MHKLWLWLTRKEQNVINKQYNTITEQQGRISSLKADVLSMRDTIAQLIKDRHADQARYTNKEAQAIAEIEKLHGVIREYQERQIPMTVYGAGQYAVKVKSKAEPMLKAVLVLDGETKSEVKRSIHRYLPHDKWLVLDIRKVEKEVKSK